MDIALSTLEYLEEEEDYVPWAAANKQLSDLRTRMTETSGYGALSVSCVEVGHMEST